ncbi:flavoprotein [Actinoplanes sp. KI2]|uniref:flavoprotein n=1 Tax=Actinoplanes sp. KI2 TaxID=2983315 RepID=UPI0021D59726|nr:flavoprotein [Actinoplanes sp. KI2]MCU7729846.1 flavoprotein [Actinoplanes sp. KI2]
MGDLRVVVCGGGAAAGVGRLIVAAVGRGWSVDVTATRSALEFIETAEVVRLSGKPVRTTYKFAPDGRRISPPADGLIVAPATFNTVNKLALGIADTYALSSVAEVIGRGVPTVVVPAVNSALAARRPFRQAIESLRSEGVRVLFGPEDEWEPLPPGQNDPELFPWLRALDLVEEAIGLTTVDRGAPMR